MPARAMSSGARPVTSRPRASTRPADGRSTPASAFSKVLLPEPFGPTTDTTAPASATTVTPLMTGSPP